MYALCLDVQRIDETIPAPVYALRSSLNASTVGIIALAPGKVSGKTLSREALLQKFAWS
jgi:hypothetical protein